MMNKTMLSILKVLGKNPGAVMGSRELSRQLTEYGIDLTERTVRYHLRILDERGYTVALGKEGRKITETGQSELKDAHVSEKVGFIISKIETLSYLTSLDLDSMAGKIILNISYFPEEKRAEVLKTMSPVYNSPYVMSERVILGRGGEKIGDILIPEDKIGIGTVCSVTINGLFLKAGIPVSSRFGGVLEIKDGKPARFTSLISYEGSSMDPLEVFIRSKMTDVIGAVTSRSGKILASFREIPVVCLDQAKRLEQQICDKGIGGILVVGQPNSSLLGVPVGVDKAGIIVVGGLNPIAAVEEAGIQTESKAMSTLYEYSELKTFESFKEEVL
jgi:HTH-type transcriptional regulator, global nitrogen regulator NrpRI